MKNVIIICILFVFSQAHSLTAQDSKKVYKKRVLESVEVDFLSSYYTQVGDNAAVSGGIGTEALTDVTGTIIISIPLNDDDVLTIDYGLSAYTSASSSNVDPFDQGTADPFQASSGASKADLWANPSIAFSHSSDDRNRIWSVKLSVAAEYDYFSLGGGGNYTMLFNEKNTELSVHGNVYIDKWDAIYPTELRPFENGEDGLNDNLFNQNTITGNSNYNPTFTPFENEGRNSYSAGFGLSQILHENIQGSLAFDFVKQDGLLSTPFQRVYFADVEDSFIDNFQLADDIERLPSSRVKTAVGGRLNWYVNESISIRSFYRYYSDDWGIKSHTASIEIPLKLFNNFTFYPSYRFYNQTAADYFNPYEEALSTDEYYTSDYDLSEYSANQFGFGVSYTDIFTSANVWRFGLKSVDLKFYKYDRNSTFSSGIVSLGVKFVMD